jgi:acylphosphatase
MFYRRKFYTLKSEFAEVFNNLFNNINLPNQLKYGSRLVGRWMKDNNDGTVEIFAIWEYDSYEDFLKIEEKVRSDAAHVQRINKWYDANGGKEFVQKEYFIEVRNEALESTIKLSEKTI